MKHGVIQTAWTSFRRGVDHMSLRSAMAASAAGCNRRGAAPGEEAAPTDHTEEFLDGPGGSPLGWSRDSRLCMDLGRARTGLAIRSSSVRRSLAAEVCELLDGSEGVRSPIGATATAGERASPVDPVLRMERARERGRRCDLHEALKLWRALGFGRLSIVATCAAEERRMLLARHVLTGARDPKALSPRVWDAIGYAAMGHSNKLIAYEMGISAPAVAKHLRRAQKTVGVSTRRELIALFDGGAFVGAHRGPTERTPELPLPHQLRVYHLEDVNGEFILFDWPIRLRPLPHSLTAAEREVVRSALAGESNVEIARARGTSTRTVANQMASVFRKLEVGSRLELFALLASGGQTHS